MLLYKSVILVQKSLNVPFQYPCSFSWNVDYLPFMLFTISASVCHGLCNYWHLACFFWGAISEYLLSFASVCSDWDTVYLRFGYCNIFPTLLIFLLYLSSRKMHICLWVYLNWISIHIKLLYCSLTCWQAVPKFSTQLSPLKDCTRSKNKCLLLSIQKWSHCKSS
jgi:hypothetical protein